MKQISSQKFLSYFSIAESSFNTCDIDYIWGDTSDTNKLKFLLTLIKLKFSDKKILEMGTYRGATACNIAMNLSSGTLYTCDCGFDAFEKYLKEEQVEHGDKIKYAKYEIGEIYIKYLPHSKSIKQLVGNTRDKKFGEELIHLAPFDLIYIDASHTKEGVKNDTELAFNLLADDGLVIWDDYNGWWGGVTEYLDELSTLKELIYIIDNRYVISWG